MAHRLKISVLSGTRTLKSAGSAADSFRIMKDYWRDRFDAAAPDNPDFIVLPEACDRFLDMDEGSKSEYACFREKESPSFFNSLAKEYDAAVIYNTRNNDRNTTFACSRSGELSGKYFKAFPMTTEMEQGIVPGPGAAVFSVDSIEKAGFVTCFDLNFDELRREYIALEPDILFFCSMYHGGLAQKTWAYSTRSYLISSICGRKSGVMAPNGRMIASTTNYTDYCTAEINLDCRLVHLGYNTEKLRAMKEKYGEGVLIDDTGYLGAVLVSNEADTGSIADLLKEFEIKDLDEYFEDSRAKREGAVSNG